MIGLNKDVVSNDEGGELLAGPCCGECLFLNLCIATFCFIHGSGSVCNGFPGPLHLLK